MCNPAIAMLAITAVSAGAQYMQANAAAKNQTQAIEDGVELNNVQTQQQYQQNNEAAAQQQSERHRQFLVDQGHLEAVLGESGLQGATQDRIQGENEQAASQDIATIESNRVKANNQAATGAQAQRLQANAQNAAIKRPSALSTGLQIGGAVANYYNAGKK